MSESTPSSLAAELFATFGPYTPLAAAWRWLSFPSLDAARKAHARGTAPLSMQRLEGRRGLFVATVDLAQWLQGHQAPPLSPMHDAGRARR